MLTYNIRPSLETDYSGIYSLIKTAFETAKVKDGDEQDFATNLRNSSGYIPELDFVAEKDCMLIGHIMFTKRYVAKANGLQEEMLLVAPLSVLLEYRNKGVGSALMKEGLKRAKELGYKAAFLAGDPGYYSRFGYKQSAAYGIVNANGIPHEFVMVYLIKPDALDSVEGTISLA